MSYSKPSTINFTDADLKRLKAKEGYWKTTVKMNEGQSESWGFVDGDKIDALISRLEAAEAVLNYLQWRGEDQHYPEAGFRIWRKTKGESE